MIPLMSVKFPANAVILFKILNFANGDLMLFELIYENTIGRYLSPSTTPPFSPNF